MLLVDFSFRLKVYLKIEYKSILGLEMFIIIRLNTDMKTNINWVKYYYVWYTVCDQLLENNKIWIWLFKVGTFEYIAQDDLILNSAVSK